MPVINWEVMTTAPTPSEVTLGAAHMHTAAVLLHWNFTLWTSMCTNLISPSLIEPLLGLFTVFPFMPIYTALEAKVPTALLTLHPLCVFAGFNHNWARRVWAKLFVTTARDYIMINLKLFVFVKDLHTHYFFNKLFADLLSTPLLRAF